MEVENASKTFHDELVVDGANKSTYAAVAACPAPSKVPSLPGSSKRKTRDEELVEDSCHQVVQGSQVTQANTDSLVREALNMFKQKRSIEDISKTLGCTKASLRQFRTAVEDGVEWKDYPPLILTNQEKESVTPDNANANWKRTAAPPPLVTTALRMFMRKWSIEDMTEILGCTQASLENLRTAVEHGVKYPPLILTNQEKESVTPDSANANWKRTAARAPSDPPSKDPCQPATSKSKTCDEELVVVVGDEPSRVPMLANVAPDDSVPRQVCSACNATSTFMWRRRAISREVLCDPCWLRERRERRERREARRLALEKPEAKRTDPEQTLAARPPSDDMYGQGSQVTGDNLSKKRTARAPSDPHLEDFSLPATSKRKTCHQQLVVEVGDEPSMLLMLANVAFDDSAPRKVCFVCNATSTSRWQRQAISREVLCNRCFERERREAQRLALEKPEAERNRRERTLAARGLARKKLDIAYHKDKRARLDAALSLDPAKRGEEETELVRKYCAQLEYRRDWSQKFRAKVADARQCDPRKRTKPQEDLVLQFEQAKIRKRALLAEAENLPPVTTPHVFTLCAKREELKAFVDDHRRSELKDLLEAPLQKLAFIDSAWDREKELMWQLAAYLPEDPEDPNKEASWLRMSLTRSTGLWWVVKWKPGSWTKEMADTTTRTHHIDFTFNADLSDEQASSFLRIHLHGRTVVDYNGCDNDRLEKWGFNFEGITRFDFGRGASFPQNGNSRQESCGIFSPHDKVGLVYSPNCRLQILTDSLFTTPSHVPFFMEKSDIDLAMQLKPYLTEITCPHEQLKMSDEVLDVERLVNLFWVIRSIYKSS